MARSFNGTTSVMDCGGATGVLDIANNGIVAVCGWANFAALASKEQICGKGFDGVNNTAYFLQIDASVSQLEFNSFVAGTFHGANWVYTGSLVTGAWNHCYGDYDGSTWHLYFNGVSRATSTDATGPVSVAAKFCIGAGDNSGGTFNHFMNGSVADVAVWSGIVLTAGEIASLASGVRPFNIRPTKLVGFWPVDGIQSPEPDLSGFSHNGTLTSATSVTGPPTAPFTPRWTPVYEFLPPIPLMGQAML